MNWSESDNYFVSGSLKIYSVDLNASEPLKLVPEVNVNYDGLMGDDFKSFLLDNGFRVNRQGKVIIRVPKRNDEEDYNFFLLEAVVSLGPYGFTNVPSPTQEVKELKRLLEDNRRLLEENRQEVKELKNLMEDTRADLAKKNAMLDELQRKNVDWNSEQLLPTISAIIDSMNRVFVDFDLKPPTSGDPKPVLRFLEKLRDLIVRKEFVAATFLGAANEILASTAGIFLRRNGISFDMVKSIPSSTPPPADLIKNLTFLREFVETRFFIDGSVIVKAYGLMNEKDIPVIFRDSEAGVAELHRTEIVAKSIDNIDGKSIFYGYFNIPSVGKFKGALTRVNVTLPDEIMVKLSHRPNQLDEKRFWFVEANGEAIFEKSLGPSPLPESESSLITSTSTGSSKVGDDFLGFLCRMNRTFVNKEGKYLKLDFTAIKYSGSPHIYEDQIFYYNEAYKVFDPISKVQYDMNENPQAIIQRRVSLCEDFGSTVLVNATNALTKTDTLGKNCAFVFKDWCFIGKITAATGHVFRKNARVSMFFEQSQLGKDCYVDALATTFFVFNPDGTEYWGNTKVVVPRILDEFD